MTTTFNWRILTINSGSSSIKTRLYRVGATEEFLAAAGLERIGLPDGRFTVRDARGQRLLDRAANWPDHAAAVRDLFDWLTQRDSSQPIGAVGHRVVHGGPRFTAPQLLTPDLLAELRRLASLAPNHMPGALAAIEAVGQLLPRTPQVACFDTAFHQTLPEVAWRIPLARRLTEPDVRRYGFHGLSYEYIVEELQRLDPAAARGRVIVAHLGNGASMAAIHNGRCLDTTMSFTPAAGLVMGTRSGDLDPGVLVYLLRQHPFRADDLDRAVNEEAGLLGVSGISPDMRELLRREATDPAAALAVELFCYQARKFIGALAAALGGLDTLVFTAGIGEHAAPVRQRICVGLGFLGVELDGGRNEASAAVISMDASRVVVWVIPTNEELMIARHTHRLLVGRR